MYVFPLPESRKFGIRGLLVFQARYEALTQMPHFCKFTSLEVYNICVHYKQNLLMQLCKCVQSSSRASVYLIIKVVEYGVTTIKNTCLFARMQSTLPLFVEIMSE